MIESFRHYGLCRLAAGTKPAAGAIGVPVHLRLRLKSRLDGLEAATAFAQLRNLAFDLHRLTSAPERWAIRVGGRWCVSFLWTGKNARDVDLIEEPVH